MGIENKNGIRVFVSESRTQNGAYKKTVLALETCKEYMEYINSDNPILQGSESYVPGDAMSLSELGKMTDAEIIGIINTMSVVPNKSDIRVMYANGYGFSWSKLQIIADFKGYINTKPKSNNPHYTLNGTDQIEPKHNDDMDTKTIYIERGTRKNCKLRKFSFSSETNKLIDDLVGSLCNIEKSKVLEALIREPLKNAYSMKMNKDLIVKYKPMEEERIL